VTFGDKMPENCIFCSMVAGKVPVVSVYEDEGHIAILDINPRNPGHTIVMPRTHYSTIIEMPEAEAGRLFQAVRRVAIAVRAGVNAQGISLAQSNGLAAGQRAPHVHFHVIPRFDTEGPPGLEELVPVKRLDPATLKALGDKIKSGFSLDSEIDKSVEKVFKEAKRPEEPTEKKRKIDFNF